MKLQITHKTPVIKCPFCGSEYLPGEIFMPGALIGKPVEIIRDSLGKIIYEDYDVKENEPDLIEHFVCDHCEKPFVVEASITYKAKEEAPENDFQSQYVSLLD